MPTISACVIAKNEQDCIVRCLQSVKNIVDELIVVDTGSSDHTVELARGLGAKTFYYEWNDDFAAARNYALDQASGSWIVFLDADEYLDQEKAANVRPLIDKIQGNRKLDSIACVMRHKAGLNGRFMGLCQTVRIFRHSPAIRYQGRIHERIHKHTNRLCSLYAPENLLLIHHTGYTDTSLIEKAQRNLDFLEKDFAAGSTDYLTYYYLSQSHLTLGNYRQSLQFARQALASGEISKTFIAYKPYMYMLKSMLALGEAEQENIQPLLQEALQNYPEHPEILYLVGLAHFKQLHYRTSLEYVLRALQANKTFSATLDNEFDKDVVLVYEHIAILYDMMNNRAKVFEYNFLSLQQKKHNETICDRLILSLRQQNSTDIAILLNRLYSSEEDIFFLVRRFAKLNCRELFAHYIKRLPENMKSNDLIGMKLFLWKRFEPASRFFTALYQNSGQPEIELMTILSLILDHNEPGLAAMPSAQDSPLKRVARVFFHPEVEISLPVLDFPQYIVLIEEICHFADEKTLGRLTDIAFKFNVENASLQIIDVLLKHQLFPSAFGFCLQALRHQECNLIQQSLLYFKAGYCCYKTKNFIMAVDYFAKSLEHGPAANGIADFLVWTHEQCNDPILQEKIKHLQAQYQLGLSDSA